MRQWDAIALASTPMGDTPRTDAPEQRHLRPLFRPGPDRVESGREVRLVRERAESVRRALREIDEAARRAEVESRDAYVD